MYAAFLAGAIKSPGEPYHEQLRFLRTLEELRPDHIRVIRAMLVQRPMDPRAPSGSVGETLRMRLRSMPRERIEDLANQLSDLRLVRLDNQILNTRSSNAYDLRGLFTPYGNRLVVYIQAVDQAGEGSDGPTR